MHPSVNSDSINTFNLFSAAGFKELTDLRPDFDPVQMFYVLVLNTTVE